MTLDVAPEALPHISLTNVFSSQELDEIIRIGDGLVTGRATLAGREETAQYDSVRITETGWISLTDETKWLYARMTEMVRDLNNRHFRFHLTGFSEPFQYTVYRADAGSHFDWHADHGPKSDTPRKLSLSVQLTDPAEYEGCDLQARVGMEPCPAGRERGTVIAFPSYVLHRVTPITAGTRKALVVWVMGPRFR